MEVNIACTGASTAPLEEFTPFQGSLKNLSDENYEKLKTEILSTGFAFALHVWEHDGKRYLIDGHQRVATLLRLKEKGADIPELPFVSVQAKDYEEAKRRVLQGVSQYGKIDKEGFFDFVGDMDIGGFDDKFDLPDIDFEIDASIGEEGAEGNTDPDEVPEVDGNPYGVERGDVWLLGTHRLMCGDSCDENDVAKLMDGEKADMVFTDPPYNQETEGGFKSEVGKAFKKQANDIKHLCDFDPKDFLKILPTVFNKNMNATIFCNKDLVPDYLNWSRENKYSFNILVWKKPNAIPIGGSYMPDLEYMLVFRKSAKFNRVEGCSYSKLIEHGRETGLHPTMKPIAIIENQIKICSDQKSLILDLFLGSGSTLIACEKTGRKCFGMEIDPHYVSVIIKRFEDSSGKKAVKVT